MAFMSQAEGKESKNFSVSRKNGGGDKDGEKGKGMKGKKRGERIKQEREMKREDKREVRSQSEIAHQ